MPAPSSSAELVDLIRKSGLVDEKKLHAHLEKARIAGSQSCQPASLAGMLVRDGVLTVFQGEQLLQGKWRRFTIGKYKVLERIGAGAMGTVYLCEYGIAHRAVAVKVLPTAVAGDRGAVERFYREARALSALQHPNIVRAFDIDQDDGLHFIVMEYVDGSSLHEIVARGGPMSSRRAAHYIGQAALGLQHAHETAAIVHRDIEPANLLVDRGGTVKIVDFGLARFCDDEDDMLSEKYDQTVLGTPDYMAPEQALDSHRVDIRADIYGLGASFYYSLTGRQPRRQPTSVLSVRSGVPKALVAIVERMMAENPADRYPTPQSVASALTPWTQQPIVLPAEDEMPRLSPAAMSVICRRLQA
jgi:serine/threonine protein kinase